VPIDPNSLILANLISINENLDYQNSNLTQQNRIVLDVVSQMNFNIQESEKRVLHYLNNLESSLDRHKISSTR
jgi:hypothetical protein